jgi:1-acyl-sn-glycerol-3-phosphate acyltransferase
VFLDRLKKAIESESDALILKAEEQGLARPIDAEMRRKLDALRSRAKPS